MNIHELSRDRDIRNAYEDFGDTCYREIFWNTNSSIHYKSILCQRCGASKRLAALCSYERMAIIKIASDPTKYLSEDEIMVCGVCASQNRSIFLYLLNHCFFEKQSLIPRFLRIYESDIVLRFYIYNTKYDYYIEAKLSPYVNGDFVIRATNFKKYDPYRVAYITLFDLILLQHEI